MEQATSSGAEEILGRLRAATDEEGLDVVVAMSPENVAYLGGVAPPSQKTVRSRHAACIVPADGSETELMAIALEGGLVRSRSRLERVTLYEEFAQDPIGVIAASLEARGLADGRVGMELTYLSVTDRETLGRLLPRAEIRGVDELLSHLRMIKTPSEIAAIQAIGRAAERIAIECTAEVGPGDTERDLANLIAERYAQAGGDALTMLVVGSGPRSAHVNAPATDRVLESGDVIRLDVIGTKDHYYSDVARTAVVGEPTAEHQRVYDLLHDVHERALEAVRPGARGSEIFRIYSETMAAAGLPAYHFLGHGLGVTLHEEPFLRASSDVRLEEGMVLCIEPLTLIEGRFGMQIEDELIVTADGFEPITRAGGLLRTGR